MQHRRAVKLFVALAILSGCATRTAAPKSTCGSNWSPLTLDKAPERQTDVEVKDTTLIEAVEIAGVDAHFAEILQRELATKPGTPVIDAPLGDDLRRLWRLGVIADAAVELDGSVVRFVVSPRPVIRDVTSHGGDALAQARFRQLEATSFEPARVRRMTDALRESYIREGRLDAKVEARQRTIGNTVDVCVALDPGPRITIAKIDFPGRKALPKKVLLGAMKSAATNRVGKVFNQEQMELDILYVSAEYWDHGFADVRVREPKIERRGKHIEIAIPVEEGDIYRLGALTMADANIAIPAGIKKGDIFSRSKLADARIKIEESNKGIYMVLIQTHVDKVKLTIDVNFEIEWRYPWDALRAWLSRSR